MDALLDFFGGGYVELAVTELGIAPRRIDTVWASPENVKASVMRPPVGWSRFSRSQRVVAARRSCAGVGCCRSRSTRR
jgi:hypothetical protein